MRRNGNTSSDLPKRLLIDEGGVVSFEYVVLAFCLVAIVLGVFGSSGSGALAMGLTNTLNAIVAAIGV